MSLLTPPPETPSDDKLMDIQQRVARVETMLFKLCMFVGLNPRNGKPLANSLRERNGSR